MYWKILMMIISKIWDIDDIKMYWFQENDDDDNDIKKIEDKDNIETQK